MESCNAADTILTAPLKKISRVARSTLAAETVALADTIDLTLWYKTILTEIFFNIFSRTMVMPNSPYPLMTPFKDANEKAILWNENQMNHKMSKEPYYDPDTHQIGIPCPKCGTQKLLNINEVEKILIGVMEQDVQNSIRTMVLTDCSNAHAAIHSI